MRRLPISIVIPTFNEEKYLPKLLRSIQRQTTQPKQIIVSDAFSYDRTREIAKSFGCRIINGGLPSKARNNGAKVANQEIIIFLDADVVLPPKFLEKTVQEMMERNLDIASCFVKPLSRSALDEVMHEVVNYYFRATRMFHPHIPGFCIFVKKEMHEKIKGFDETILLCEDHDYVRRAKKNGRFGYLDSYKIPVSVRRLSEEGRLKLAAKYIAMEFHLIFLGKIKKQIINYQFGHHYK